MPTQIIPNQFDLRGGTIRISYSTSSFAGGAQLTFKKGRLTLNFRGSQINEVETSIGSVITVVIGNVPDKSSTSFSFLLPAINLATVSTKQAFRTIGITTTHKTSIGGPPKGVLNTYRTVELSGVALQVAFLGKAARA